MKTTILNHLQSALTAAKAVLHVLTCRRRLPSLLRDNLGRTHSSRPSKLCFAPSWAAALLKTKQAEARAKLGAKHIHHPHYRFDPRHSNDTAIYPHFRTPYLNEVRDAAEVARSDNPAHLRHIANLYHMTTRNQGARA